MASSSPRRAELMAQIGLDFNVIAKPIDELIGKGETPEEFVRRVAIEKARVVSDQLSERNAWIVGGDTVITIGGDILGKPKNELEAKQFLIRLSGNRHSVFSAVSVVHGETDYVMINKTEVVFKRLSNHEIDAYLLSKEYQGKAGGYAIQGLAAAFVELIEGSYFAVMGLPLFELNELLIESGYKQV